MTQNNQASERLLSLDFFRGLTMFLLIAEFTRLFWYMHVPELEGTVIYFLGNQLRHHPWHGLHAWDLVQPFFMFIVGVAMPLSYAKRIKKGETHSQIFKHITLRCFLLLFLGWFLSCISAGKIVFFFQNVLAQLAVNHTDCFSDYAQKGGYSNSDIYRIIGCYRITLPFLLGRRI